MSRSTRFNHAPRPRPHRALLALLLLAITTALASLAAAQPATPGGDPLNLSLDVFVAPGELESPVDIAHAGDGRLFVVELEGRVRIVRPNGDLEPTPFLDIASQVRREHSEQGLLGLVFHPDYAENGYFYVNYTAEPDGETHIARFTVSADPDVADPNSELTILTVDQPFGNHNAGDLLFGPQDRYLYIPLGDGGGSVDAQNRAQNMTFLLGKLLRLDVDAGSGGAPDCGGPDGAYTIPEDNPFSDGQGGDCDEIWASGLRNPWRASFDRQTADLYMGDVGQNSWEEIDFQPASSTGGENYGWPCFEGTHEYLSSTPLCSDEPSLYDMPVYEIEQNPNGACAITGGYVYRGSRFPQMVGHYFFSDLCAPYIWDLETETATWNGTRHDNMQSQLGSIVSFGEDVSGELYLAKISDGAIYHLVEDTLIDLEDGVLYFPAIVN